MVEKIMIEGILIKNNILFKGEQFLKREV